MSQQEAQQSPVGNQPQGQTSQATDTESPKWEYPWPLGLAAARGSMTGVAAPLLAGFSIALLGVIAQAPASFRWPSYSIFFLLLAAILLVACIQCGFWARAHLYSPQDIEAWRPGFGNEGGDGPETLRTTQINDYTRWKRWEVRAAWTYDLGIVALAVAVALTVAPRVSANTIDEGVRWGATALAAAAAIAEIVWMAKSKPK